ncbi:Uncharacterised protein [Acinetobacter baumannii]|uniref:hypothetical protein n=1 Tax=Acinetobacter baumannii TaxID=470 RepID=UPI000DE68DB8|nr:hypothetical protein [Acinetobacter baumannii]SSQ07936.1 Uncharacterised protein [Acinetobacter baumannii]
MATLATNVSFQCFGPDGKPLAGGKVYSYAAGTTTNKATYTTMAGTVANPNPVILDQNGKAKIFLGDGSYRLQIKDSNDALIDDIDQISRYVTQSEFASFQQTVNDGVAQLTEVREQIDVYVNASIGDQKGYANGIAPLDANVKIDPIYFPIIPHSGVPQATETQIGVAEIATQTEVDTATDDTRFVTPKKLLAGVKNHLNASGSAPIYACRAWVNFNGTGTVAIRASGNVSSITDNGVGNYTINFTTALPDANYVPQLASTSRAGDALKLTVTSATEGGSPTLKTTNALQINYGAIDLSEVYVSIFR